MIPNCNGTIAPLIKGIGTLCKKKSVSESTTPPPGAKPSKAASQPETTAPYDDDDDDDDIGTRIVISKSVIVFTTVTILAL